MKRPGNQLSTVCAAVGVACMALTVQADDILLKNGYVLDLNGNAIAEDGSITIGSKGLIVRSSDWVAPLLPASTSAAVTLIAEIENVPVPATDGTLNTLLTVYVNNSVGTSCDVGSDGVVSSDWNHGGAGFVKKSTLPISAGKHRLAFVYKNGWGAQAYADGTKLTDCTGASAGNAPITRAYIGQFSDGSCVAQGLKVMRIAVVDGQLSAVQAQSYVWPAEGPYGRFTKDFMNRVVTCTAGYQVDIAGNNFKASQFDPLRSCVITPALNYQGGTSYTTLPGYVGNALFWHAFCQDTTDGYVSPGMVLRFPPCPDANGFSLDAGFGHLNLGGLIVEAGANPGSKPVMFYEAAGKNRETIFGDRTGKVETYFVFNDDLSLDRRGPSSFYGTINLDIAAGKCFDCTTGNANAKSTAVIGSRLKMHGNGTFKVRTLTAKEMTLDYSDLALGRATPYIDGNLEIDAKTRFAFPAGLAAGTSYAICSGMVQTETSTYDTAVTVGGVEKRVKLSVLGNTVSYAEASASVDGVYYTSAQDAFDAATATSILEFFKPADVMAGKAKTLKKLIADADLTIAGEAVLTFSDTITVKSDATLVVATPVSLSGVIGLGGGGKTVFTGSVSASEQTTDTCQLVVFSGHVDFDGSVSGVTVCGRGSDPAEENWPVITLLTNCTVDASTALVSPALASGTACYGKVVQDGATVRSLTDPQPVDLMDPHGGACKYELRSGMIDAESKWINLMRSSQAFGSIVFEQDGGLVKTHDINVCRIALSPSRTECYHYVLNGGTLMGGRFTGAMSNRQADPEHFDEKIRVELNGGTYHLLGQDALYVAGTVHPVVGGPVKLVNNEGATAVATSELTGHANLLTLAGEGRIDLSPAVELEIVDLVVTAGTAVVAGESLGPDSAIEISAGAKIGVVGETTTDVESVVLGGRQGVMDRVYGFGRSGSSYFVATSPAGSVRPAEGREAPGLSIIFR